MFKKIYGEPSKELIKRAKGILEKDSKENKELKYNTKECKELFKNVLKEMNLNWDIKINEVQSSKISVVPEEKAININGKVLFSENDLKRLIVHEIGTHVSRVKRGTTITENPNVFVKDYIYLDGYYKVKKFLENSKKNILYTGIVGIDESDKINTLIEKKIIKEMEAPNLEAILKKIIIK